MLLKSTWTLKEQFNPQNGKFSHPDAGGQKKKIVGLQNIFWSFTAKQSCSETTEVDDQKHVACRRSHIDQERRVLHPEIFTDAAKLNALASTSSGRTSLTAHQGCK